MLKFLSITKDSSWPKRVLVLGLVGGIAGLLLWLLIRENDASLIRGALPTGLIAGFIIGHIFWTSAGERGKDAERLLGDVPYSPAGGPIDPALSGEIIAWREGGDVDKDNPLEAFYKGVWSKFGPHPFTHISQDSMSSKKAAWVLGLIAGALLVSWALVHFDGVPALWATLIALGFGLILGRAVWTSAGRQARQAERLIRWMDRSDGTISVSAAVAERIRDWQGRRSVVIPTTEP